MFLYFIGLNRRQSKSKSKNLTHGVGCVFINTVTVGYDALTDKEMEFAMKFFLFIFATLIQISMAPVALSAVSTQSSLKFYSKLNVKTQIQTEDKNQARLEQSYANLIKELNFSFIESWVKKLAQLK